MAERNLFYEQLQEDSEGKRVSAQALKDLLKVAYDKGHESGYREALYKLYGGSLETPKEKADARRKD